MINHHSCLYSAQLKQIAEQVHRIQYQQYWRFNITIFQSMILDFSQIRGPTSQLVPRTKWTQKFRSQLCRRNLHIMKTHPKPQHQYSKQELSQLIVSVGDRGHEVIKINTPEGQYSEYGNFVPLRTRNYISKDEWQRDSGLVDFYKEADYEVKTQEFYEFLKKQCTSQNFLNKLVDKYCFKASFTQKIQLLTRLLCYGTASLSTQNPHLYHILAQYRSMFDSNRSSLKQLSISMNKNDKITLSAITNTMKSLFCPLCFIYDCSTHGAIEPPSNSDRNYQFVSLRNKRSQGEHIKSLVQMLDKVEQLENAEMCSSQCCKNIGEREKDRGFLMRCLAKQSALSDLGKCIMGLGVHLFSYNPCMIRRLFPEGQYSCSQVYKLLEVYHQVESRLDLKLYKNQQEMLHEQQTSNTVEHPKELLERRRRRAKRKQLCSKQADEQPPSICLHHFLDQQSQDAICQSCRCNQRGYCLPSCLCSSLCPLMKLGCKCKRNRQGCNTASCPCYKNGIECIPQICGKNCWGSESCCNNRQIQLNQKKNIKVGVSKIPEAGLGVFAGEPILKDSLVTVYLGEQVSEDILIIRDRTRKNNSFYNFDKKGVMLDAKFYGNKSRFINHNLTKCSNLKVRIVESMGQNWVAFYAVRDIEEGEELYFDYDGDGELAKNHADKYPFILQK